MNPSDLSKHGKKKLDVMDLAKKPRKMDKLDKISGLGAANRSISSLIRIPEKNKIE